MYFLIVKSSDFYCFIKFAYIPPSADPDPATGSKVVQRAGGHTVRDWSVGAIAFSRGGGRSAAGSKKTITAGEPDDQLMMFQRLLIDEDYVELMGK